MSEELKPCPFCGGAAILQTGMGEFWVVCENSCLAMQHRKSLAMTAWNKRFDAQFWEKAKELGAIIYKMNLEHHRRKDHGDE